MAGSRLLQSEGKTQEKGKLEMKNRIHAVLIASLVVALVCIAGASAARADSIVAWGRDAHGQVSKVPAGDDFIAISRIIGQ